jgi:hypothetical protein
MMSEPNFVHIRPLSVPPAPQVESASRINGPSVWVG